jgi:hypothetical protein
VRGRPSPGDHRGAAGGATIQTGTRVIVRPYADCDGDGKSHRFTAEAGRHGVVTGDQQPADHSLFVLFKGGGPPRPFGVSRAGRSCSGLFASLAYLERSCVGIRLKSVNYLAMRNKNSTASNLQPCYVSLMIAFA